MQEATKTKPVTMADLNKNQQNAVRWKARELMMDAIQADGKLIRDVREILPKVEMELADSGAQNIARLEAQHTACNGGRHTQLLQKRLAQPASRETPARR